MRFNAKPAWLRRLEKICDTIEGNPVALHTFIHHYIPSARRLEKICDTIEGNVKELHATHSAEAVAAQLAASARNAAAPGMDADTLVNTIVPSAGLQRQPAQV